MLQRSMTNEIRNDGVLSDFELLAEVKRLTAIERQATSHLIAALGELDARRLYLGEGCSSLFSYCTRVLHLSEHAAYLRIEAARAARKWPAILGLLADGALHLTAIGLLAPHLSADNLEQVLAAARHKSKREVEEIVASLRPRPVVPSSVTKMPTPKSATAKVESQTAGIPAATCPAPPATNVEVTPPPGEPKHLTEVTPLAPERYRVQFTVSRETYDRLREARDLLRHRIPDGDIAAIFDRALAVLLAELRKARHGKVHRPRAASACSTGRHVPAAVKRAVWERDKGQCAFLGTWGRCTERGFLEYHHRVPFADGGATTADNLELRCRAHNAYEAELWFGPDKEDLMRERQPAFSRV
jgi:5-methylcytosine-specific restriction endonuclease McrA